MDNYLVLNFKNAGLFRKKYSPKNKNFYSETKDKIFCMSGSRDRKNELEFAEPITFYQISNVLHVLFGERPVPSMRECLYKSIPHIDDIAKNSYLKIDSTQDSKGRFHTEKIQLNKAVWNSWNPQSFMNWERVRQLLGEELFKKFENVITEVFGSAAESFNLISEKIKKTKDARLDEIFIELNRSGKSTLFKSVFGTGNELADINKNSRTMLTVLRGLDNIVKLNGQILVPVTSEDMEKIKKNKGCATILDGGLVSINRIKSSSFFNPEIEGFVRVGDINLNKQ